MTTPLMIMNSRVRGSKRFPYEELASATRGFSKEAKLGERGFGSVYKSHMKEKLKLAEAPESGAVGRLVPRRKLGFLS